MEAIETDEIRDLARRYEEASVFPWRQEELRGKLESIAQRRASGELEIFGDDGADRDEAIEKLRRIAGYYDDIAVYLCPLPEPPPGCGYFIGTGCLGMSGLETNVILSSLKNGRIPARILRMVMERQSEIQSLHPDKQPWKYEDEADVSRGLEELGIDTRKVWKNALTYFNRKGMGNLAGEYAPNAVGNCHGDSITRVLAHYALTRFHNIRELDRNGREIRF
jgi:hypothetical protein